ncbi:MAG: 5-deoxy-glucuronate isomerase [Spirochaetales bacterium]|nr:5-deoxy-glucuronate isomerase [Spirochaetales bacterium]
MIVKQQGNFPKGYTAVTEQHGKHNDILLDFGILKMEAGDTEVSAPGRERAWLLIGGTVTFSWEGKSETVTRRSCFEETPFVLHVSKETEVTISTDSECELCVEQCDNETPFPSKLYRQEDIRSDIFGGGVLDNTSMRTVRTVFDGEINPDSNMVMGEVINHPGKWSSYPPHDHPHPEIYHYRLFPEQGFGISMLDNDAFVVKNGDTCLISPDKTHSQVAGAGYAMYYIWMIPHLPGDKWLPTTRYFRDEHKWMLKEDVKIWPELKHGK